MPKEELQKKYIVIGGTIIINNQRKYFDPVEVCRLYKVNPRECHLWNSGDIRLVMTRISLPILRPRPDGIYTSPEQPITQEEALVYEPRKRKSKAD